MYSFVDEQCEDNFRRLFGRFVEENRPDKDLDNAEYEYIGPSLQSPYYYTGKKPFHFWWYYLFAVMGLALPFILYVQMKCVSYTLTVRKQLIVR